MDCESYFKLFPWFFSSSNQRLAVIKLHLKALLNCLQYCYKWHWQKKGCRCSKKVERFHISNPFSWWSYDYYNEKKALKIFQTKHLHTLCSCFICVTPPTVLEVPVCSCGQLPDGGDIGMCLVLQTMGAGSCLGPFAQVSIWHRPLLHLCFLQRWLIYIYIITHCINVLIQCVRCPWTPSCFQLIWGLVWDIWNLFGWSLFSCVIWSCCHWLSLWFQI